MVVDLRESAVNEAGEFVLAKAEGAIGDDHIVGELGELEPRIADAIIAAADEALEGKWANQFVVDPFQAGAGTSHNMNVNEVLANRACEILGGKRR